MNTKPILVGVTGGIGSGKSLVCKIFKSLKIPIYDADSRAKWLTNENNEIRLKVIGAFGPQAYNDNGLDRDYISKEVFNDNSKLKLLNGIIHPEVGKDFKSWVETHKATYLIKEAALLFESGSFNQLDYVITVTAPVALRVERTLSRDSFRTEKEVKAIISKQLSEQERQKMADFVVNNDNETLVIPQVLELHEHFLTLSKS